MTEAPTAQEDGMLGTREAAARLGVSRRYLMTLIYSGEISTIRMPSTTGRSKGEHRIEPSEIEAFKDRHRERAQ